MTTKYFFEGIQKTKYVGTLELCTNNRCKNFQANIFIFGCVMNPKPSTVDDVIFVNAIFGIPNCRGAKQMTFFESLDKTGQDTHF